MFASLLYTRPTQRTLIAQISHTCGIHVPRPMPTAIMHYMVYTIWRKNKRAYRLRIHIYYCQLGIYRKYVWKTIEQFYLDFCGESKPFKSHSFARYTLNASATEERFGPTVLLQRLVQRARPIIWIWMVPEPYRAEPRLMSTKTRLNKSHAQNPCQPLKLPL